MEPLILHDAEGDSRYAPGANQALGSVQNIICIPVLSSTGACIGACVACNRIPRDGSCPAERASFADLDIEMGLLLTRIVGVHVENATSMQSGQLGLHCIPHLTASKEGMLLLLDARGYITESSAPLSFLNVILPEDESRKMQYFELLEASGNPGLSADIRRVYDTGEAVVSSDGPLQTPSGTVRAAYFINALMPTQPGELAG
jgi:hypothetical protein